MRVLAVFAHPNSESYCAAIFDTAVSALREGGHLVDSIRLYEEGFDPSMTGEERRRYESGTALIDRQVIGYAELVRRADVLVFVYPTWWFGLPAILKGWLDRVLVPGVAFRFDEQTRKVRPGLLRIRRIVGVSTYGSPWLYVRFVGDGGRRTLLRAVKLVLGPRTGAQWIPFYGTDSSTAERRQAFLATVARAMTRL